jgi:hypothetical protein
MWETIRAKILEVITENAETIQEAHRTLVSNITGWPVAMVYPTEDQNDYHNTAPASDKDTYVFIIRVLYPFVEGQDAADIAIGNALDELKTIFKNHGVLDEAGVTMLRPVPSTWGYVDTANGRMRAGDLKLQCVVYS